MQRFSACSSGLFPFEYLRDIEEICYSFNGYSMSSWLLTRNNSWAWKQFTMCILEAFGIQFDDDCAVIHKGCWRANSCEAHFWINQSELQFWYSATFFIKNIFAPEGDTLRDGNIQLDIHSIFLWTNELILRLFSPCLFSITNAMTSLSLHKIDQIRLIVRSKMFVHKKIECNGLIFEFIYRWQKTRHLHKT